jgi:hypothetical protein
MSDSFEKITHLNLSGDTYESEQRYRLVMAVITFVAGFFWLPITAVFWVVTVIKLVHYSNAMIAEKRK